MKKNILVVDDSALMRRAICDIINADSDYQAIDVCRDGLEAYKKIKTKTYDAIVLDVNMPRMDGLQLLEKLQQEKMNATVIMVSTVTTNDADVTMLAMERGAIDFVTKPTNIIEAKGLDFKSNLIRVLNAVIKSKEEKKTLRTRTAVHTVAKPPVKPKAVRKNKLIALACSTGGPKALQSVIPFLKPQMDAPMVLVQHMPSGFTKSMADRLNELSGVAVKEAEDGDILEKGAVYIAPGGRHLKIQRMPDGRHRVVLNNEPAIGGLRPCANVMYNSLKDCSFDEITCVILTGMGADGTKGIKELASKVPVYVIAQDAASSVVYGMPRAITETGLTDEVVPLNQVAESILKNVGVN